MQRVIAPSIASRNGIFLQGSEEQSLSCPRNTCLHLTLWGLSASAAFGNGVSRWTGLEILQKLSSPCLFSPISYQTVFQHRVSILMVFQKPPTEGSQKVRTRQFCSCQAFELRSPPFMVSITCLGWVKSYSQIQMQARFLQGLSPCPAPEPPCSTHCSVSRHRCAKFLQGIKLCKWISNIHTIHPHLCVYVKSTAGFFGYFCFLKNV